MVKEEEKIVRWLKITGFLLITLLGTAVLNENLIIILLLFYIAFIKD